MSERGRRSRGVRIEEVARVAGVSPITVSRAIGNPGRVSEATRLKVLEAVSRTGYVVNPHASSLATGRSSLIPVFVSNLRNPHFATALQGASDAFEGSRYHLLMTQTNYSDRMELEMVKSLAAVQPAAAMFTGMVQSEQAREMLRRLDIPVVEMWDFSPNPLDMLVGFSNAEGGRLMGEHFGASGFSRIAYAGRTRDRGAQRLAGFQEGLALYGKSTSHILALEGSRSTEDGSAALDELLALDKAIDAIFFATDSLAIGAIMRARELSLDVPGRLAIAGYGDLDTARQILPTLTTIHVASHEMGLKAGQMLRNRLEQKEIPSRILRTPVRLEIRQSTSRG